MLNEIEVNNPTYEFILSTFLGQDQLFVFLSCNESELAEASWFSFHGITFIIYLLFVVWTSFQEPKKLEYTLLLKAHLLFRNLLVLETRNHRVTVPTWE